MVSRKDKEGKIPLHYAAKHNNINAARMFLKNGSKVMPKDNEGKTPLDYSESGKMIELLKENGAKEL